MSFYIYDIEADNLLEDITKVWCAVFKEYLNDNWIVFADLSKIPDWFYEYASENITIEWKDISEIKSWIDSTDITGLICHNQLGYDLEVMRRFFDIPYTVKPDTICGKPISIIDTYVWSTRLNPARYLPYGCPTSVAVVGSTKKKKIGVHGLESWGYRVSKKKPSVSDWSQQKLNVYIHRCIEDVGINEHAYRMMLEEKESYV